MRIFLFALLKVISALSRVCAVILLLYIAVFTPVIFCYSLLCVCVCSRPVDDGDYDDDLADEESNHAINDLSSGRVMTCTGLVEMPKYVPRGRTLNCADVCMSVRRR